MTPPVYGPDDEPARLRFLARLLEGADAYQSGDALARASGLAAGYRFRANELAAQTIERLQGVDGEGAPR